MKAKKQTSVNNPSLPYHGYLCNSRIETVSYANLNTALTEN